ALRLDHLHELLDDVDVRRLDDALLHGAEAVLPGDAGVRRPRRRRLAVQVLPLRLEAGGIDEGRDLDLADRLWQRLSRQDDAHRAVAADRDALRRRRDRDAGLHREAGVGDELAGRRNLERAVARVAGRAVGQLDLEEPVAADRDVERVGALLEVALAEVARGRDRARAEADLETRRQLGLVAARRAGLAHVLVHQVFEDRVRALVAVGR